MVDNHPGGHQDIFVARSSTRSLCQHHPIVKECKSNGFSHPGLPTLPTKGSDSPEWIQTSRWDPMVKPLPFSPLEISSLAMVLSCCYDTGLDWHFRATLHRSSPQNPAKLRPTTPIHTRCPRTPRRFSVIVICNAFLLSWFAGSAAIAFSSRKEEQKEKKESKTKQNRSNICALLLYFSIFFEGSTLCLAPTGRRDHSFLPSSGIF